MQVTNVSNDDGRACAHLITFLKAGRWELTGDQPDQLVIAKRWLSELATQMATDMKARQSGTATPEVSSASGSQDFKIKAMGPLPTSPSTTSPISKRKSKKS